MHLSIAVSRARKAATMLAYGEHVDYWTRILHEAHVVMREHGMDV